MLKSCMAILMTSPSAFIHSAACSSSSSSSSFAACGSSGGGGSSSATCCALACSVHCSRAGCCSAATMLATAAAEADEARLCLPGTLASRVEDAVCFVYGAGGTARVRRALRKLSDGETLDRTIDESHELMVQQANSFVEELTARPWHDATKYKWAKQLESKWRVVAKELATSLRDATKR